MVTAQRARTRLPLLLVALCLAGNAFTLPAHAQVGRLMGSTTGSYCKFKKKEVISVYTTLSLAHSETFARQMTLRRLASMAKSQGFPAILVSNEKCGTMLINGIARTRSCTIEAHMEASPVAPLEGKQGGAWMTVDGILRDTDADAPSYPRMTGLMSHGNKCVIE